MDHMSTNEGGVKIGREPRLSINMWLFTVIMLACAGYNFASLWHDSRQVASPMPGRTPILEPVNPLMGPAPTPTIQEPGTVEETFRLFIDLENLTLGAIRIPSGLAGGEAGTPSETN